VTIASDSVRKVAFLGLAERAAQVAEPPILTFFKADFALVTPQKELILIEIEKAHTRLLTKRGEEHSELAHAVNQVRSWLHTLSEHRLAVLASLKIAPDAVGKIRGLVVAGRDAGYDAEHLRILKGAERGPISFLTYDDLAQGLSTLIRRMTTL
jgi:hypothetical protein